MDEHNTIQSKTPRTRICAVCNSLVTEDIAKVPEFSTIQAYGSGLKYKLVSSGLYCTNCGIKYQF
jgi:hypothetical protein